MATDKSEPQVGLIFRVGILVVIVLVGIHAGLSAYFDKIARAEEQRKIGQATPAALQSLRMSERERLTTGAMPIDVAMKDMISHGRGASTEIVPTTSHDTAPLAGWAKMSADVPPAMTAAPSAAPAAAAAPAVDGGAKAREPRAAADAGVKPAGARKAPLKRKP